MAPEIAEWLRLVAWDADCAGDTYTRNLAWRAQTGDETALAHMLDMREECLRLSGD